MSKVVILTGYSISNSNNATAGAFKIIRGTRKYEYLQVYKELLDPDIIELRTIQLALQYLMEEIKVDILKKIQIFSENAEIIKLLRKYSKVLRSEDNSVNVSDNPEIREILNNIYALEKEEKQFQFKYISKDVEEKPNEEVCDLALKGAAGKIDSYKSVSVERKRCFNRKKKYRKRIRKKGQTRKPTPHGVRR